MTIKYGFEVYQEPSRKRMGVKAPDGAKIYLDDDLKRGCVLIGNLQISFDLDTSKPTFYSLKAHNSGTACISTYAFSLPCKVRPLCGNDWGWSIDKVHEKLRPFNNLSMCTSPVIRFELSRSFAPINNVRASTNNSTSRHIPPPQECQSGDFLKVSYNGRSVTWPVVILPDGKANRFNVEFSNGACELIETIRLPRRIHLDLQKVTDHYYRLTFKQQLTIENYFTTKARLPHSVIDALAKHFALSEIFHHHLDASLHLESSNNIIRDECKAVEAKLVMLNDDDWD